MKTTMCITFALLAFSLSATGQFQGLQFSQQYADEISAGRLANADNENYVGYAPGTGLTHPPRSIPDLLGSSVFDVIFFGTNPTYESRLHFMYNLVDSDPPQDPYGGTQRPTNNGNLWNHRPRGSYSHAEIQANPEIAFTAI